MFKHRPDCPDQRRICRSFDARIRKKESAESRDSDRFLRMVYPVVDSFQKVRLRRPFLVPVGFFTELMTSTVRSGRKKNRNFLD